MENDWCCPGALLHVPCRPLAPPPRGVDGGGGGAPSLAPEVHGAEGTGVKTFPQREYSCCGKVRRGKRARLS